MFSKATVFAAAIAATSNALSLRGAATDGHDADGGKPEADYGQWVELQTLAYSFHKVIENAWLCHVEGSPVAKTTACTALLGDKDK